LVFQKYLDLQLEDLHGLVHWQYLMVGGFNFGTFHSTGGI